MSRKQRLQGSFTDGQINVYKDEKLFGLLFYFHCQAYDTINSCFFLFYFLLSLCYSLFYGKKGVILKNNFSISLATNPGFTLPLGQ